MSTCYLRGVVESRRMSCSCERRRLVGRWDGGYMAAAEGLPVCWQVQV